MSCEKPDLEFRAGTSPHLQRLFKIKCEDFDSNIEALFLDRIESNRLVYNDRIRRLFECYFFKVLTPRSYLDLIKGALNEIHEKFPLVSTFNPIRKFLNERLEETAAVVYPSFPAFVAEAKHSAELVAQAEKERKELIRAEVQKSLAEIERKVSKEELISVQVADIVSKLNDALDKKKTEKKETEFSCVPDSDLVLRVPGSIDVKGSMELKEDSESPKKDDSEVHPESEDFMWKGPVFYMTKEELDAYLENSVVGKKHFVSEHGFVALRGSMGNDHEIAESARISYQLGTKKVNNDKGLIRYLASHKHTTPFEQVEVSFSVRAPIFVARQWFRHRTFSYNEESARYSELRPDFFIPEAEDFAPQSKDNKQGRDESGSIRNSRDNSFKRGITKHTEETYRIYKKLLEKGVSREIARTVLPVSTMTTFVVKGNLKNWMHFVHLRKDKHAQKEIRVYAEKIYEILKTIAPLAVEAYDDYVINAVTLSATEQAIIGHFLPVNKQSFLPGIPAYNSLSKREKKEIEDKIDFLVDRDSKFRA